MGTNVGTITGITSDLAGESETVAASIKAVNQLNSNLSSKQEASTAITTYNIGKQSVRYADSAGNVDWNNVIGRPNIANTVTTVTTETKQITINASSFISIDLPFATPSGFLAIGVVAVNANTASSAITRFMIVDSNVRIELRNMTSGQQTITISAIVLCKANAFSNNIRYTLGTLPMGYHPLRTFATMVALGRSTPIMAYLSVTSAGLVTIHPYGDLAVGGYTYCKITFNLFPLTFHLLLQVDF